MIWSIITLKTGLIYPPSFLCSWALTVLPSPGQGPVSTNKGGSRSTCCLPDTGISCCPHSHAARETLLFPLCRQGRADSWLSAEVARHLLWGLLAVQGGCDRQQHPFSVSVSLGRGSHSAQETVAITAVTVTVTAAAGAASHSSCRAHRVTVNVQNTLLV